MKDEKELIEKETKKTDKMLNASKQLLMTIANAEDDLLSMPHSREKDDLCNKLFRYRIELLAEMNKLKKMDNASATYQDWVKFNKMFNQTLTSLQLINQEISDYIATGGNLYNI